MQILRSSIRIVLFVASTLGVYVIWFVGRLFVPNKIFWRQTTFSWWTRSFGWIANMRVEIHGPPPKPPFFLVTNHIGYADIAALRIAVNGVFVAKTEIQNWFIVGRIVRDMGIIFIDRTKRHDIPRAGELVLERLDNGEGVFVFPEGTSSDGSSVLPFKSSFLQFAAEGDVPVSYAAITFTTPAGALPASKVVCWSEDISFAAHIWRLFKQPGFVAKITFGDTPLVNHDRKDLAKQLHSHVSDLFVPVR